MLSYFQSREVSKPWDLILDIPIAIKFGYHHGSNVAEMSVKFQSDKST